MSRKPATPRRELPEIRWQRVLMEGLDEARWTVMHVRKGRVRPGVFITPTSQPGWPRGIRYPGLAAP